MSRILTGQGKLRYPACCFSKSHPLSQIETHWSNLVNFKDIFLWLYEEHMLGVLTLTGGRATGPGTVVTPDDGQSSNFIVRVTGILDYWAMTGSITSQGGPLSPKHGSRERWASRGYGGHRKTVNCKLAGTLFGTMIYPLVNIRGKHAQYQLTSTG